MYCGSPITKSIRGLRLSPGIQRFNQYTKKPNLMPLKPQKTEEFSSSFKLNTPASPFDASFKSFNS